MKKKSFGKLYESPMYNEAWFTSRSCQYLSDAKVLAQDDIRQRAENLKMWE